MTTQHQASRTLVKSPPELWAECSDAGSLGRHIGEFGEIRITRLEPETTVAWEGEHASGTVQIEPAGWGTRVTLTAHRPEAIIEDPPVREVAARRPDVNPYPPTGQAESPEEEADAQLEETLEEPDTRVVADADRDGGRWRRVIARTRGLWRRRELSGADGDAPAPIEPPPPETVRPAPEPGSVDRPESEVAPSPESEMGPALESEMGLALESGVAPSLGSEMEPALDADAILAAALDSLGQAHHRPFSRA